MPPDLILRPDSAGDKTEITNQQPTSGSHYDKVNDQSDLTYVIASTNNTWVIDLYGLANTSETGTIISVTSNLRVRGETVNNCSYKFVWKTYNTEYESVELTCPTSYTSYTSVYTINPNTGSAWSWDEINALQVGVSLKGLTLDDFAYCSEAWITVQYNNTQTQTISNSITIAPTISRFLVGEKIVKFVRNWFSLKFIRK